MLSGLECVEQKAQSATSAKLGIEGFACEPQWHLVVTTFLVTAVLGADLDPLRTSGSWRFGARGLEKRRDRRSQLGGEQCDCLERQVLSSGFSGLDVPDTYIELLRQLLLGQPPGRAKFGNSATHVLQQALWREGFHSPKSRRYKPS